jgi:hypothetical protein
MVRGLNLTKWFPPSSSSNLHSSRNANNKVGGLNCLGLMRIFGVVPSSNHLFNFVGGCCCDKDSSIHGFDAPLGDRYASLKGKL